MRCLIVVGLIIVLAACSGDGDGHAGSGGTGGVGGSAIAGATSGNGGVGGMAGTAAAGSGAGAMDDLSAHVEDVTHQAIELLRLACASDCVDIEAIAQGGNPPYTFQWEDGSTGAARRVCLDTSTNLTVTVTDTGDTSDEFPRAAQTVSAEVMVEVVGCSEPGPPCTERATAGSFDPVEKWRWSAGDCAVTPLVANLTDDNGDGKVDLMDTPDVVVVDVSRGFAAVLDGATGVEHYRILQASGESTPAIGDIDGDDHADIVLLHGDVSLGAYHGRDGSMIWRTPPDRVVYRQAIPLSLADLDHDGKPEIISSSSVHDSEGNTLWTVPAADIGLFASPTAVDLDDDGFLEVVWGGFAMRHDGSQYYRNAEVLLYVPVRGVDRFTGQYAAVADLDLDGNPEVVVSTNATLFVLDNHGNTLHSKAASHVFVLPFPPAIHDLDGDGAPEIMVSDGQTYTAFEGDLSVDWSMPVTDNSGIAAGTAFDFLGDGTAEAMYGDETMSWGFDGADGHVVFMQARASGTVIEYPTVADVDNDGSADILITSAPSRGGEPLPPTLLVISDRDSRWIPARRILNQDAYHVTNIDENGHVPQHEIPHWKLNNSFRAQAQINRGGAVCLPIPD